MDFLNLSAPQFENLVFDLVVALGLRNVTWRTPGSDEGRDIEGNYFISDLSGHFQCQKWYVECKRYEKSVDWPTVWEKISYADNHKADILLFVTSSSLSPQALNQVRIWNEGQNNLLIRVWGNVELEAKLNLHPQIARKYGLKASEPSELDIFYPSMFLLTKISYSMSPETAPISDKKLILSNSLSKLIITRMIDIKEDGRFIYKGYCEEDYLSDFEHAKGKLDSFDETSSRAFLAYIDFILKEGHELQSYSSDEYLIKLTRPLISSEESHLRCISDLSNFSFLLDDVTMTVQLNKV